MKPIQSWHEIEEEAGGAVEYALRAQDSNARFIHTDIIDEKSVKAATEAAPAGMT